MLSHGKRRHQEGEHERIIWFGREIPVDSHTDSPASIPTTHTKMGTALACRATEMAKHTRGPSSSFSPLILWGTGSRFLNITGSHGCSWGWSRKNSPVPGVAGKTGEDRGPKEVWELKCRIRECRTEVRRKDLRTQTFPWRLWRTHLQTGILAAKAISAFVCHFLTQCFYVLPPVY